MTKTCGECCYFTRTNNYDMCAMYAAVREESDCRLCEYFTQKVVTKGDKLRQMSNDELAEAWSTEAFRFAWCYDCMEYCKDMNYSDNRLKCKQRMIEYLNAPAEREVKNE